MPHHALSVGLRLPSAPLVLLIFLTTRAGWGQVQDAPSPPNGFREHYGLAPDEVLKRIVPPFPEVRLEFYIRSVPEQAERLPQGPEAMVVEWRSDGPHWQRMHFGDRSFDGMDLESILECVAKLEPHQMLIAKDRLNSRLRGDWVTREGADTASVMAAMAALLSDEWNVRCRFTPETEVADVIVLKGRIPVADPLHAPATELELPFAEMRLAQDLHHGMKGPLSSFVGDLSRVTGWKIINLIPPDQQFMRLVSWGAEVEADRSLTTGARTPRDQIERLVNILCEQAGLQSEIVSLHVTRWRLVED